MIRARLPAYTIHIVSSVAITSLSYHLLSHRQRAQSDRVYLSGKFSILESLVERTRRGEDVSYAEFERLLHLANSGGSESGPIHPGSVTQNVAWKDAILGRRRDEEAERRELEAVQKEWEDALAGRSEDAAPQKPLLPIPQATPSASPNPQSPEFQNQTSPKERAPSSKKTVFY
ncbi:hypothetical protein FRC03_011525 [Tulasnella sp. 419]|nr:hypothetical protein FRC02_008496 [Tulasnella sp. 418]KAG8966690.1 hypothetical protein FRC03_011525 [Tulasnella sp. 419]